ncbi:hypothetical protein TVAG_435080 [Trichomonas vaginalis G3]|uniref:Uncharacterized protein n=1 Tax=Trichomonas vaginalis (strain ATCC PRA-98 / G3) TaxID=412133 RepID=A2FXK7_TRIV3|nr:flavodoxin-like fold [Trichomonas vaginalis G3]EAX90355.1 hypothetical protein TVAG_435080 [Trichomonas vaginalis G3]KAI5543970.1 flavodoxin-like fold [Trichomonas vaginalis G3]|eukprot:XP_001303285.1 hypothetical protein [Trichomonas vaginalis G3]
MSLLLKYIDAPPQNPIDFKIPLSDPMDWPLIPSIQDLKINIPKLRTEGLRASVHHLAVLTLYETSNVYFTTQP